ncbi:carboxyvinyl-carboxyphosphonate phosphorylmutase [Candidimonas nitroreducens]|uniref:Carboxyvinyl-carboxyphosphonate phosphorylmutase n=2 Tax=Candidimonas nitroreducens TaxID=683354 RepID=A0A225M6D5_9BURK|nr:carboxyvinyl-carboxyphosphonate phosphorylmutase [Candidimonas nitroreducens]
MSRATPLPIPGPYDALSAQLLERLGFKAIWGGGMISTAATLGTPDVSLLTVTEHLRFCSSLAEATGLPVVADCDSGYGDALNVARTVQLFDRGGVAAIVIEDQRSLKQASLYDGSRSLASRREMVGKIKAAVDSRFDEGLMVWARTDSFAAGVEVAEALERAHAYAEAGADLIVPVSRTLEPLRAFARAWDRPTPLCIIPTFFPRLSLSEIAELGFSASVVSLAPTLAALHGVEQVMKSFIACGSLSDTEEMMASFDGICDLVGYDKYRALAARYIEKDTSSQ